MKILTSLLLTPDYPKDWPYHNYVTGEHSPDDTTLLNVNSPHGRGEQVIALRLGPVEREQLIRFLQSAGDGSY